MLKSPFGRQFETASKYFYKADSFGTLPMATAPNLEGAGRRSPLARYNARPEMPDLHSRTPPSQPGLLMLLSPLSVTLAPPLSGKTADRQRWGQWHGAAASLAAANAARSLQRPLLWIARDTASARRIETELRFFGNELPVLHLPDWETLPYDTF